MPHHRAGGTGGESTVTPALYRGATALAAPFVDFWLARRRARGREDAARFAERHGIAARPRPAGSLVWLHAASVGEAQAILSLVHRLVAGDARHVLVTTGTVTSATLLAGRLPSRALHHYVPVDRLPWVRRFLDHWQPDLALWVQSELWPNLVLETAERGIPMAIVNGRMSERSLARWTRLPGLIRPMLAAFDLCLAANDDHARRFAALGARDVRMLGNLKFAADPLPVDAGRRAELAAMTEGRPLWLAASTHDGEEQAALAAHRALAGRVPGLLTVIVPRHPERGAAVARVAAESGLVAARRAVGEPIRADTAVYVADTMGEMGLFYQRAGVVFVGGSIAPRGGHNPIEPALFDCAILHGPDMANNREIAAELAENRAARIVTDGEALTAALGQLFADGTMRDTMAAAARQVALDNHAVLDRVLACFAPYLDLPSHARA
jgi:3-deoxy-D-manno-octulosonic-acid transferase